MLRRLCVFCGSSLGIQTSYAQAADQMGRLLAGRGIELVYGGGNVGLMGRVADACLAIPGGYGTWEELPDMADRAVEQGFVRDAHRELLLADNDPGRLLDRLMSYTVPVVDKWLDRSTR